MLTFSGMKKMVLTSTILALVFGFSACKKGKYDNKGGSMTEEAAALGYMVEVSNSDFTEVEKSTLVRLDENSPYTSGSFEYIENGAITATIVFNGTEATCSDKKGTKKFGTEIKDCDKKDCKKKGCEKTYYKKVITAPIVKSSECQYIVKGIVKFFDAKTGDWVATFDYGDGTCDDLIDKTTKDDKGGTDVHTFSMKDYPEWN